MTRAFICGCEGANLSTEERAFLRETQPWGMILFRRNVVDRQQMLALTTEFRSILGRDAPVLIDQEGGRVQRMSPPHWRAYPAAERFDAELSPEAAVEAARLSALLMAHDLREVGVNVDCAPVVDVADAETHAVIGSRAYGRDPGRVAELASAVAEGLLVGGVLPVIKHIPGHGRARADSHLELPTVHATRAELVARDFAPFRALNDLPVAMTAHVVYTALDPDAPATTSAKVIRGVIRAAIGFSGLLLSDDLSMKALGGPFAIRAKTALTAGCDIVLHCNGDLTEARAVAEASPALYGASLQRAEAALRRIEEDPDTDIAEARARLMSIWPALLAA